MRPYGNQQAPAVIDRKRRYLSGAMSHNNKREERHGKRVARAEGKTEIAAALDVSFWDGDDIDHEADMREAAALK